VAGGALWVVSLTAAGFAFGNVTWVNDNLTAVIMGIIVLSWCRASWPGSRSATARRLAPSARLDGGISIRSWPATELIES
jgi:membrane-associated protein